MAAWFAFTGMVWFYGAAFFKANLLTGTVLSIVTLPGMLLFDK